MPRRHVWNWVDDFGGGRSGTDAGALMTRALQTIASAGGGELQMEDTFNVCETPILLPTFDRSTYQRPLRITGRCAPPTSDTPAPIPSGSGYTVFKDALAGSAGALLSSPPSGRSNIHVELRDLVFEAKPNPSNRCLDLRGNNDVIIERVLIYSGTFDFLRIVQPTNVNGIGISLPKNFNSAFTSCRATVWGHYAAFELGELLIDGYLEAEACWNGIVATEALHQNNIQFAGLYECKYGLVGAGTARLKIGALDLEHATQALVGSYISAWMTPGVDVYDPNNLLRGELTWHISEDGHISDTTFTRVGGAGLVCRHLGDSESSTATTTSAPVVLPPSGTVIEDTFCTDGPLSAHVIAPFNTGASTWETLEGALTIYCGRARAGTAGICSATTQSITDGVVSATFRFAGVANGEIILRVLDKDNFVIADLDSNERTLNIYVKAAGSNTRLISQPVSLDLNTDILLTAQLRGTAITVTALGYTITAMIPQGLTINRHGLRVGNSNVAVKDFSIQAP